MNSLKSALILFFLLVNTLVFGQDKVEYEERIKKELVPLKAKEWLSKTFQSKPKVKWFKENSENGFSFEAKFKLNKSFYSAEFDSLGLVLDVEKELKWTDLENNTKVNLGKYLDEDLKGLTIEKIQIQFSGSENALSLFFRNGDSPGILKQYEIEFQAFDELGDLRLWEGTFDEKGNFLNKRRISIRDNNNISF